VVVRIPVPVMMRVRKDVADRDALGRGYGLERRHELGWGYIVLPWFGTVYMKRQSH
jgi:hypothetical protein